MKKLQAQLHNVLLGTEDKVTVVRAEKDVLAAQLRMAKRQVGTIKESPCRDTHTCVMLKYPGHAEDPD